MIKKLIKHAFVSGIVATINGKPYTRILSKEEEELLKNAPAISNERRLEIDELMKAQLKELAPDFYKKIYEKNEILLPI